MVSTNTSLTLCDIDLNVENNEKNKLCLKKQTLVFQIHSVLKRNKFCLRKKL